MAEHEEQFYPAFPPKAKPYVSVGLRYPEAVAHHVVHTYKVKKIYIIVSASISKTPYFKALEKELYYDDNVEVVGVRKGIKSHTPWVDILEIVKDFRRRRAEVIVTLGAGSLTDGAKVVSWALANGIRDTESLERLSKLSTKETKPCKIPIINVPTTLSGGEYSPIAGATNTKTNRKVIFKHPSMGAGIVILDPALSITTPEETWLASGVRSVDHCVEGICSLQSTKESDEAAKEGLKLLVPNLLKTKKNWEDEEPRLAEMKGVIEAMRVIGFGVQMGGSHGIGHQLGPLGVGHGQTSCVMLPSVLKYNFKHGDEAVRSRQEKILEIFWGDKTIAAVLKSHGLEKNKADGGDVVRAFVSELGLPSTLKDVGIEESQLDALADNCLTDPWLKTNPIPLTEKQQVLDILKMALGE